MGLNRTMMDLKWNYKVFLIWDLWELPWELSWEDGSQYAENIMM
jgi:hypothetical protein